MASMNKHVREALKVVTRELKEAGVEDFEVIEKRRHFQVRWEGGSVGLACTPSDKRKVLVAVRASVRSQLKGVYSRRGSNTTPSG